MIGLRLADVRTRRGDYEGARAVLAAELDAREHYPEENAMLRSALAVLTYRAGDAAAARELADEAMREMRAEAGAPSRAGARPRGGARRGRHARALRGRRARRQSALLAEAYAVALATRGHADRRDGRRGHRRRWPRRSGLPVAAAEILGAAARLRGAEDATHPEVARLTVELRDALGDAGFADAFGRGRALDRDDALSRLDPQRLA